MRNANRVLRPHAALYMRVSTAQQKPDLQRDGLFSFAEQAGLEIVGEYNDRAVSGRKEGRSDLNTLMQAARNREFDCVLVWKFDRFARSVSHLLKALEEFDHLGIRMGIIMVDSQTKEQCRRWLHLFSKPLLNPLWQIPNEYVPKRTNFL